MDNRFDEHKKGTRKYLFVIGFILLFLCAATSTFGETVDLLKEPSEKAAWAAYSILMDVAKVNGRIVVVGEQGHILYSDDECEGWIQAKVPVSVTLTAVCFPTYDRGWAVGHDGVVLHTEDGGKTWKKQLDGWQINKLVYNQMAQMVNAKNDLLTDPEARLTEEQREDLELKVEDLDYLLSDMEFTSKQGPCQPLMDVWFKNEKEGIIIGVYGLILSTTDGGSTWRPDLDRIDNTSGHHYYSIERSGGDLFIAGEAGALYRSENFGQSWQHLQSPYEGSFFGLIGDPSGGFITVFGLRGHIYYSVDRGETWNPLKHWQAGITFRRRLSIGWIFCVVGIDGTSLRSKDRVKPLQRSHKDTPGEALPLSR